MFGLGPFEIVVIFGVLLLFFGGKLIPKIGRNIGDTIREIRRFSKNDVADEDEIDQQKPKLIKPQKMPSDKTGERES